MLETLILISISVFMNMTETSAEDAHCDNVWGGLSQERLSLKSRVMQFAYTTYGCSSSIDITKSKCSVSYEADIMTLI